MKRIIGLSLLALSLAAAGTPAAARDGEKAAAAAIGVIGGLALGSALAGQQPALEPAPVYVRRRAPVVVEEVEEPVCVVRQRRYVDEFGDVTIKRVRVCD